MSTRDIRRRIKSIKNTRQITKAMEMVAASKMQKAVGSVLATRNYSNTAWEMLTNLSNITGFKKHALLRKRKVGKILLILITSDKGLCGMYNSNIIKSFLETAKENEGKELDLMVLGKKGEDAMRKLGKNIVASFVKFSDNPSILDVKPVAKIAIEDYIKGRYNKVYLAFTDYVSALNQVSHAKQLLPLEKIEGLAETKKNAEEKPAAVDEQEYLFEPTADEVLEIMLPRLVEMQIYQAVLESKASEHSSRMMAMRNASDGASDLIDNLTLSYNQARQSSITSELADIIGGTVALEG